MTARAGQPEVRARKVARVALAAALVLGALLFVIGTRGETHTTFTSAAAATTSTSTPTTQPASSASSAPVAPETTTTVQAAEGTRDREAQEHGATTIPATAVPAAAPAVGSTALTTTTALAGEGTPSREAAESAPSHVETTAEQSREKILGVNPESGAIVASVVIVSILLAGLVLARRYRTALWAAIAFCALAAAADLHELHIQADRSKTGLAVIAATVAAVHIIGAITGVVAAHKPTRNAATLTAPR